MEHILDRDCALGLGLAEIAFSHCHPQMLCVLPTVCVCSSFRHMQSLYFHLLVCYTIVFTDSREQMHSLFYLFIIDCGVNHCETLRRFKHIMMLFKEFISMINGQ